MMQQDHSNPRGMSKDVCGLVVQAQSSGPTRAVDFRSVSLTFMNSKGYHPCAFTDTFEISKVYAHQNTIHPSMSLYSSLQKRTMSGKPPSRIGAAECQMMQNKDTCPRHKTSKTFR